MSAAGRGDEGGNGEAEVGDVSGDVSATLLSLDTIGPHGIIADRFKRHAAIG